MITRTNCAFLCRYQHVEEEVKLVKLDIGFLKSSETLTHHRRIRKEGYLIGVDLLCRIKLKSVPDPAERLTLIYSNK